MEEKARTAVRDSGTLWRVTAWRINIHILALPLWKLWGSRGTLWRVLKWDGTPENTGSTLWGSNPHIASYNVPCVMWHGTPSTAYEEGDGWIIKDVATFLFPQDRHKKSRRSRRCQVPWFREPWDSEEWKICRGLGLRKQGCGMQELWH